MSWRSGPQHSGRPAAERSVCLTLTAKPQKIKTHPPAPGPPGSSARPAQPKRKRPSSDPVRAQQTPRQCEEAVDRRGHPDGACQPIAALDRHGPPPRDDGRTIRNSILIAASACRMGVEARLGLQSKPIHRRPAHPVQLAIQQHHPVRRLAARQRQVAQPGSGHAAGADGRLQRLICIRPRFPPQFLRRMEYVRPPLSTNLRATLGLVSTFRHRSP